MFNYLANLLTILSLTGGFASIIFCIEGHFTYSAWAILCSLVFDGLDGQVARLNPSSSDFGKELDSLADAIAFGAAPVLLGYVFIYPQFDWLAFLCLTFYLACCVWRLAKYNITHKAKAQYSFSGLPTTIGGGILASIVVIYRSRENMAIPDFIPDFLKPQFISEIFLGAVIILSLLMISKIPFLNLDGIRRAGGKWLIFFVLLLAAALGAALYFGKAGVLLLVLFLIYLLFSPVMVRKIEVQ